MSRCSVWKVVLLGLLFPLAVWAGDEPLVSNLQVRGTRRPVQLESRAGEPLDLTHVERDVRYLWATGYFEDIQVERADSPQGVRLTFVVVEKPRLYLRKVQFIPGGGRLKAEVSKGMPVDRVFAARVARTIRKRLVEQGYTDASVRATIVPAGFQKADLQIRVERGQLYRVGALRFTGNLGLDSRELERAVDDLRPHRLLPSLGPLWHGWRSLAPFSEQDVQAGAERLRSLYLSHGFFDARVGVERIDIARGKATVVYHIEAGRRYNVRRLDIAEPQRQPVVKAASFPNLTQELCGCLLKARRESEKRGELAVNARLEARPLGAFDASPPKEERPGEPRFPGPTPEVSLTARIEASPVFRVGRIDFVGNRKVNDLTLRKALALREGDLFDQSRLRRSVARLTRLGLIQPLGVSDVRVSTHAEEHIVDLAIPAKDGPRGYWSLSGPLGPLGAFGSLGYMIGARLPAVGGGPLELSTYFATFSLLAWSSPLTGLLPLAFETRWAPFVAFERPYLPGQGWQSGFTIAPQLGWRATATSYGLSHVSEGLRATFGGDSLPANHLSVPLVWRSRTANESAGMVAAGHLICVERKSFWARLRSVAGTLSQFATGAMLAGVN